MLFSYPDVGLLSKSRLPCTCSAFKVSSRTSVVRRSTATGVAHASQGFATESLTTEVRDRGDHKDKHSKHFYRASIRSPKIICVSKSFWIQVLVPLRKCLEVFCVIALVPGVLEHDIIFDEHYVFHNNGHKTVHDEYEVGCRLSNYSAQ